MIGRRLISFGLIALAAHVAAAAPLVLFFVVAPDDLSGPWAVPWAVAPVLGAMVFQLLSRPQPEWGWGLAFAGWLGVVFGLWAGFQAPFEHAGGRQAALLGVYIFALAGLAGMGGASLASLVVRVLGPRQAGRAGLAVMLTDVLVVAVLIAVLR